MEMPPGCRVVVFGAAALVCLKNPAKRITHVTTLDFGMFHLRETEENTLVNSFSEMDSYMLLKVVLDHSREANTE